MRIAFIMGHMRMGGAERVVSLLCEQMVQRGDDVTLINLSHARENFFVLPKAVHQINLDTDRVARYKLDTLRHVVHRVGVLRREIKQVHPDVLFAFTDRTNILALLANLGLGYPLLVSVRRHPRFNPVALRALTHILYPMASAIVSVNSVADQWYHHIRSTKRYVIPNPVQVRLGDVLHIDKPPYHIVSLGRLEHIKNHALLIRAFAQLADEFPGWDVQIYGSGREYTTLHQLITSLGLVGRVSLNLPVHDVVEVLSGATIYVQPSLAEGFPNAVLDAMACYVPVIVTDYQGNPRDLVTHRQTGVIVPTDDDVALVDALRELMRDSTLREDLGRSAGYAREVFSIERITQQWYEVIRQILD